jgi:hypothetical protein
MKRENDNGAMAIYGTPPVETPIPRKKVDAIQQSSGSAHIVADDHLPSPERRSWPIKHQSI